MIEQYSNIVDRAVIIQALEQWGTPFSTALLDPACTIFKVQGIDGFIGYRKIGSCIMVFGEPVCPAENLSVLMNAFHHHFTVRSINIIYIAVSQEFKKSALHHKHGTATLQIADEIILDPMEDPMTRTGKKASLLRNKYNQSIRDGVQVKEYLSHDPTLEQALENIGKIWSQQRKGPQMYLFSGSIFENRPNKRWFYAEHNHRIIGLVLLNRVGSQQGWVLNILMTSPEAPPSTSEFMILALLAILRTEECRYFSMGPSPVKQLANMDGFGALTRWIAYGVYGSVNKIFRFYNRQRYWEKFHPQKRPSFFVFNKARIRIPELIGIMRAFNLKI